EFRRVLFRAGDVPGMQKLLRVVREADDRFTTEELAAVRFVPLIGAEGWRAPAREYPPPPARGAVARLIAASAEPFADLDRADLDAFLTRVGDARVVLLGEATHGTSEFYRMRARMTRALIEHEGFSIVAVEADWPDAA